MIYSVDDSGSSAVPDDRCHIAATAGVAGHGDRVHTVTPPGRTGPDFTELGAGEIGGLTLVSCLYKWSSAVLISTDVTLSGGADDWCGSSRCGKFEQGQTRRELTLTGGALPKNVFFGQVRTWSLVGTTRTLKESYWPEMTP